MDDIFGCVFEKRACFQIYIFLKGVLFRGRIFPLIFPWEGGYFPFLRVFSSYDKEEFIFHCGFGVLDVWW